MAARLKEKYHGEIKQSLQKELGLENAMAVPKLEKIVINMGLGEATQNVKIMDPLLADLGSIAGQKPVITMAREAVVRAEDARVVAIRRENDEAETTRLNAEKDKAEAARIRAAEESQLRAQAEAVGSAIDNGIGRHALRALDAGDDGDDQARHRRAAKGL